MVAMPSEPLWAPTPETIAGTNIGRFDSDEALRQWSVDDIAGFWAAVWQFFDVQASVQYSAVLDSVTMPGTKWLTGARLNYAEHILRREGDRPAIIAHSQTRPASSLTWDQLADLVGRARSGLKRLGVGRGEQSSLVREIPVRRSPRDGGSGRRLLDGRGDARSDQVAGGGDQGAPGAQLLVGATVNLIRG